MSKQHYEALARALGTSVDLSEAVAKVSAVLLDDNPNFDPGRFKDAVIDARLSEFAR